MVDSTKHVSHTFRVMVDEARELNVDKYWLNAEEILAPKLCGSSGTCLDCGMSVDQVTAWSGIFSAFNRILGTCL